jgi:hypothetical protein
MESRDGKHIFFSNVKPEIVRSVQMFPFGETTLHDYNAVVAET